MDADFWDTLGKTAAAAWQGARSVPLVGAPVSNLMGAGAVSAAIPYELGKGVYEGANTAAGVVQDIGQNSKFALPPHPVSDSDPSQESIAGRAFEAAAALAAMRTPFHVPEGSLGSAGGSILDPSPSWEQMLQNMRNSHNAASVPRINPDTNKWNIPLAARDDPMLETLWNRNGQAPIPETPSNIADVFAPRNANGVRVVAVPSQLNGGRLDSYVDAYFNHSAGLADHGVFPEMASRPSMDDIERTSNPAYFKALMSKADQKSGSYLETDPAFVKAFGNNFSVNQTAPIKQMLENAGVEPHDFVNGMFGPGHQNLDVTLGSGRNAGKFSLEASPVNENGDVIGRMAREFNPNTKDVYHDYFELGEDHQGKGYAKDILAGQVDQYKKLGYNSVSLLANIDVGGYAWAKYGFKPSADDWAALKRRELLPRLDSVSDQLDPNTVAHANALLQSRDPAAIHELAAIKDPVNVGGGNTPFGKHMLLGTNWRGKMDLNDPATMTMFDKYVRQPN